MVSAVFHSPLQAQADARAARAREARPSIPAAEPEVMPAATRAAAQPFDWRGLGFKVLPPLIGVALLVGLWGGAVLGRVGTGLPALSFAQLGTIGAGENARSANASSAVRGRRAKILFITGKAGALRAASRP